MMMLWWLFFLCVFRFSDATYRYYNEHLAYATGDTILSLWHNHGGPRVPHRKWNMECLDGEAMTGVQDFTDDFERLTAAWCKFMFPYKPPSHGVYPYYPNCVVRNFTNEYFCFHTNDASRSINTFVTALWDNEFNFYVHRPGGFGLTTGDDLQPYKCCKTPKGYYIDYLSCHYIDSHDPYREFYDSLSNFIMLCPTGYVMTGISKKLTPFEQEYHVEWIQCCRVGYGAAVALPPPVYSVNGKKAFYANSYAEAPRVPEGYIFQYKTGRSYTELESIGNYSTNPRESAKDNEWHSFRYTDKPIPKDSFNQKYVM
ncbi:uncharacterized protein LOC129582998 isoform X1 [Paramacrobiotus metropolitanus]|uniref:uncharacterized protein LOC129582998 isoform X1 n=2 Tax=Paramacrobiotus metropolitanus TaxID=2943436 RepID=UPI00244560AF|nr:uncharacterized protein LOC129582998 isoform X1 [Paramacrobiotus metropolitanus]XP_055330627.1 uncharacterized protein LOC129582998 isoform X1 [Paramacrobiotus metropolitanus]